MEEEGLVWQTSSYSSGGANCVEVAKAPDGGRLVRHSRWPNGVSIHYTDSEWDAFIRGAKDGEFD